jgi:membrane-associated phospholipid phosphatase
MRVGRRLGMIVAACALLRAGAAAGTSSVDAAPVESPPASAACPVDPVESSEADAETSSPDSSTSGTLACLPKIVLKDAVYVLGSPVRWTGQQWLVAGGAIAGLVVVSAFADVAARDHTQSHQSAALDDLTRVVEPFGQEYAWAVLGAYGVVGLIFHDADARDTAIDGAIAYGLAGGIITPSFKRVFGRARPNQTDDPLTFHPFESGFTSLPSGHATQAFAVASVISAHSDRFWVSASAYTVASLVAFARVYHNAHWTSDVVAGALIGTLVGRSVVALNRRIRSGDRSVRIAFAPILGPDQRGAGLTLVF